MEQAAAECDELQKNIAGRSAMATETSQILTVPTLEERQVEKHDSQQDDDMNEKMNIKTRWALNKLNKLLILTSWPVRV